MKYEIRICRRPRSRKPDRNPRDSRAFRERESCGHPTAGRYRRGSVVIFETGRFRALGRTKRRSKKRRDRTFPQGGVEGRPTGTCQGVESERETYEIDDPSNRGRIRVALDRFLKKKKKRSTTIAFSSSPRGRAGRKFVGVRRPRIVQHKRVVAASRSNWTLTDRRRHGTVTRIGRVRAVFRRKGNFTPSAVPFFHPRDGTIRKRRFAQIAPVTLTIRLSYRVWFVAA